MEHLVQFRLLVDTLTQTEYEALVKCIDKNDMLQALFDYHMKELQKNETSEIGIFKATIKLILAELKQEFVERNKLYNVEQEN